MISTPIASTARSRFGYAAVSQAVAEDERPRCSSCGLLIFDDAEAAARADVPFSHLVNQDINGRCTGCAGGDMPLTDLANLLSDFRAGRLHWQPMPPAAEEKPMPRQKKEPDESAALYQAFETGVKPPAATGSRGMSKYEPLVELINDVPLNGNGRSEWCRIGFAEKRLADNAKTAVRKRMAQLGLLKERDLIFRAVPDDGCAWLYFQWIGRTEPEDAT